MAEIRTARLAAMLRALNNRETDREHGLTFTERCTRRLIVRELTRRERLPRNAEPDRVDTQSTG